MAVWILKKGELGYPGGVFGCGLMPIPISYLKNDVGFFSSVDLGSFQWGRSTFPIDGEYVFKFVRHGTGWSSQNFQQKKTQKELNRIAEMSGKCSDFLKAVWCICP